MLKAALVILAVSVVTAAIFIAFFYHRFTRSIDAEEAHLLENARPAEQKTITLEMLAGLPAPMRRYLIKSGVVGKTIPTIIRVRQTGRIRGKPDAGWMTFEADQVYSTNPPAFVWRPYFPRKGRALVIGRDAYLDGKGSIDMKMLGIAAIANARGPDIDHGALMRYLNEMMWFPMAYLGDNVRISAIDDHTVEISLTDRGVTARAQLIFDSDDRLIDFQAMRIEASTGRMQPWATPLTGYGAFSGLTLPNKGSARSTLPDGDFTYIELDLINISYN